MKLGFKFRQPILIIFFAIVSLPLLAFDGTRGGGGGVRRGNSYESADRYHYCEYVHGSDLLSRRRHRRPYGRFVQQLRRINPYLSTVYERIFSRIEVCFTNQFSSLGQWAENLEAQYRNGDLIGIRRGPYVYLHRRRFRRTREAWEILVHEATHDIVPERTGENFSERSFRVGTLARAIIRASRLELVPRQGRTLEEQIAANRTSLANYFHHAGSPFLSDYDQTSEVARWIPGLESGDEDSIGYSRVMLTRWSDRLWSRDHASLEELELRTPRFRPPVNRGVSRSLGVHNELGAAIYFGRLARVEEIIRESGFRRACNTSARTAALWDGYGYGRLNPGDSREVGINCVELSLLLGRFELAANLARAYPEAVSALSAPSIIATREASPEQIVDFLRAIDWDLTPEQWSMLGRAVSITEFADLAETLLQQERFLATTGPSGMLWASFYEGLSPLRSLEQFALRYQWIDRVLTNNNVRRFVLARILTFLPPTTGATFAEQLIYLVDVSTGRGRWGLIFVKLREVFCDSRFDLNASRGQLQRIATTARNANLRELVEDVLAGRCGS